MSIQHHHNKNKHNVKRIVLTFIYCISTILVFILPSCTQQELTDDASRQIVISASLNEDTPITRAELTQGSGSLNLLPKWKTSDKIDLFIIQGKNVYPVSAVPVKDIRNDGNTCSITFTLPFQVDTDSHYSVVGLFNIEGTNDASGKIHVNAKLKRLHLSSPIAPMWFKVDGGPRSIIAHFQHLGTYELLHIKNTHGVGIYFQHCGFQSVTPWYKYEDQITIGEEETPQSTSFVKGEAKSGSYFVPGGSSFDILSWYIPSGVLVNEAKLVAIIDGKTIVSANSKSSGMARS